MVASKRDGLLRRNIHDEILVFHPDRSEATALNESAALVFDMCDGTNTVDSIRQALDDAGLGPSSDDAVWLALTELADAELIDLAAKPAKHLGRRELLKRIGVGAAGTAAVLPVVETIAAPAAAAQGSGPGGGSGDGGGLTPAPTLAPTTMVPTTAAPTTAVPTTMVPTTAAPTTVMPTTPAPTSGVPTTVVPTTPAPTPTAPSPAPTPSPTGAPT